MFCRYKGFFEFAKSKGLDVGVAVGLDVIVDGIVPTGIAFTTVFVGQWRRLVGSVLVILI